MDEKQLIDLIKEDKKKKKNKYVARKYYSYKPKSKEKTTMDVVDENGNIKTIIIDQCTEIYFNYFKFLVNQKINYLLSKEPTFIKNSIFTSVQLVDMLEDLMLNASLDTTAWLHFYVDEESKTLEWLIVNDCEIIPFYDKYNKKIVGIIRYYEESDDTIKVEQWDKTGVTYTTIKKDKIEAITKEPHYFEEKVYNGETEKVIDVNFPFIPFIPLYNNKSRESDLEIIYDLIVFYNSISSGFIDNIYKFQEAITKLKGFSGDPESLRTTMKNLKIYKAVGMPEDGDIDTMVVEIPVEARTTILEILKKAIFSIGGGYDPDQVGDGNITNVVITNRYYGLDSKTDASEKCVKMFYENFIDDLTLYYGTAIDKDIGFNRNKLINENDTIDGCLKSIGIVSMKTIRRKHPWVIDEKEENEQIKLEEQEKLDYMEKVNKVNNVDLNN